MRNAQIENLGLAAESIGATIMKGALTYPSENGGFALGDLELDEYLYELRGQELMLIVVPPGEAAKPATICGLCRRHTPETNARLAGRREKRRKG